MTKKEKSPATEDASKSLPRRQFLLSTGGAVASALLASCDGGTGPAQGGTVNVEVTGVVGGAAGSVVVTVPATGDPAGVTIVLPAAGGNGISQGSAVNMPPATYRLVYTPPAGHLLTGSATRDVVVTAGSNQTITFALTAVGTLNVTVNGLAAGAASAGTLAIAFQSGGAVGSSVTLSAPAGGTSTGTNTTHPVGSLRITHTPPAGHTHVAGDNEELVTLTPGAVANATFTVQETVAPPTGLVFVSDWGTAVGGTSAAVLDTGKAIPWDGRVDQDAGDPAQNLTVVAASGVNLVTSALTLQAAGWPTPNALRLRWPSPGGTRSAGIVYRSEGWTHPAIGESLYLRWYFVNDGDDALGGGTDDNSNHSIQSIGVGGAAGACATTWQVAWGNRGAGGVANGTWRPTIANANDPARFRPNTYLTKGAVYRFELRIHRTAQNAMQFHARIFNSAGAPVLEDNDFVLVASATTLADNPNIGLPDSHISANCLRNAAFGAVGSGPPEGVECYVGAVAISRSDWCGPYVPGEAVG